MAICLTLICIHMAWGSQQWTTLNITFYSCTALVHLSSSHLCAATMTVQVAFSAWMPWWHLFAPPRDNNSSSAKRAGVLTGRLPPGASRSTPKASPPPLCSPRSGHKVLSYSHQTVCLEAAADVTVSVFGFVSWPRLFSFSCILSAVAARALGVWDFWKSLKNVAYEREAEALAPAPCELSFFFLSLYSQKYKVNSLK